MSEPISIYFQHKLGEEYAEKTEQLFERVDLRRVWPVWHRTCGDIAFVMLRDPREGPITSHETRLFNGRPPEPNSPMVCETCGATIKKLDLLAEPPPRYRKVIIGPRH